MSLAGGLAILGAAGITTATTTQAATVTAAVTRAPAHAALPAAVRVVAPASAPAALAPITPQGAIAQGAGCTGDVGAAVTCTLTAQPTADITAGGATAHVWSFVGATGGTSVNNPTIVATAGQPVTINVTNGLPTLSQPFPLSLAIPGMPGISTDYQGADAGQVASVSFTPQQSGTYIYQAGHILRRSGSTFSGGDVGPREVAMGLAGVLIVRPSDFVAGTGATPATTGQTVFGLGAQSPANQFDDEAALLLSDVDPAFAAAPDTYDLRKFNGTIRLINGKAYPNTDPIASGPGRKVLLRYANAGVVSHSMGVLGARQSVVGIAGHASSGQGLIADTITAGTTEDAVVSVPSTGSGKLAVADASGRLDTNGAASGARRQLAFGGMLTFVTYDAASVTADTVGPNSTITGVTPNPVNASGDVTVTASFVDPPVGTAGLSSAISNAEVAIDSFAASGNVTFTLTSTGPNSATGTATIPAATLAGLSSGTHNVLVRAYDSATPANVGPTASQSIVVDLGGPGVGAASLSPSSTNGLPNAATDPNGVTVSATGDASATGGTVASMAYSIDGGGSVAFPAFAAAPVVAGTAVIPWATITGLTEGAHTVTVTATDTAGVTSGKPATLTLTYDKTGPVASGLAVSPNPTNGAIGDNVDPTSIKVSGSFTDALSNVVAAEGFLQPATAAGAPDTTRTCGSANFACTPGTGFVFVATDGIFNAKTEAAYGTFPLSQLVGYKDGTFTVWVHGKDAAGNWTQLTPTTFVVDRSAPTAAAVLAQAVTAQNTLATPTLTVTATDVGTPPSAVTAAEWFEGADPGVGLATPVAIGSAVPVQLASGRFHTVSVRVKDAAGNWSAAANSNALYVDPIFADSFGTFAGSGAAWTGAAAVGGVTFPAAPTGMNGRAMLTGNGTATSNVTTPVLAGAANPAAATYNARFLFENNGVGGVNPLLTSAAGWVNIASLRQGGTDVVDVQYNRGSAAAAASLRLRYRTSTGAYVTTAAAAPLPGSVALGTNGVVHTIRVGWTSGATGTLTLRVDAGAVLTVNANTGTNTRVDRTVLGLVNGTANGAGGFSSGRAYFDNFEARRNSQP